MDEEQSVEFRWTFFEFSEVHKGPPYMPKSSKEKKINGALDLFLLSFFSLWYLMVERHFQGKNDLCRRGGASWGGEFEARRRDDFQFLQDVAVAGDLGDLSHAPEELLKIIN